MNWFKKFLKFFDLSGSDEYEKLKTQMDSELNPAQQMTAKDFHRYVRYESRPVLSRSGINRHPVLTRRACEELALARNGSYSFSPNKRQEFYD